MTVARDHGSGTLETVSALLLAQAEVQPGDPLTALELCEQVMHSSYVAGDRWALGQPLATMVTLLLLGHLSNRRQRSPSLCASRVTQAAAPDDARTGDARIVCLRYCAFGFG
jgi:hypothetical protein